LAIRSKYPCACAERLSVVRHTDDSTCAVTPERASFPVRGATMDATERDHHDATAEADAEDTSILRWSSSHLDERRIRRRFMLNSQVVSVWVYAATD